MAAANDGDATHIFHEKQYGSMCGQHCLNNLLQGPYFTPNDLAGIARELDQLEAALLQEQQPSGAARRGSKAARSHNVDDSGNFSIQVLSTALQRSHDVSLVRDRAAVDRVLGALNSDDVDLSSEDVGFVCNLREHWFAIRSVRGQFYDLNSLKRRPQRVSLFHLSAYLAQLRQDGYSIFVADGKLPPLLADPGLMGRPEDWYLPGMDDGADEDDKAVRRTRLSEVPDDDPELREALRASMRSAGTGSLGGASDAATAGGAVFDEDLRAALAMSVGGSARRLRDDDGDEDEDDGGAASRRSGVDLDDDEDADLRAALAASMQGHRK